MLKFAVTGIPVPQGSKTLTTVNGKTWMREANNGLHGWRDKIATSAIQAKNKYGLGVTITEPVYVNYTFFMPKPKTVKRPMPSVKPDLDKLIRAVNDALTKAGVIKDDSQIVDITARKVYAESTATGVVIQLWAYNNSITDTDSLHAIATKFMQE